ncbi:type IV secretion system DNA-binding domain-containing protein [Pseudomonas syringae]|uniref:type IV secretion system DNA-binding domain-containing protein n=2 Tax=Pseudomonas syringae TaxID=317 RepID=UPI001F43464D|nr:type IV secretion system DNA-binding domain-containing protein [Pseudomonas syringae]MCF5371298.1 type IV secretion system DNA-binding domain-containing protein [Pseudomonas syringae]MCF5382105.1 type IV secretion system DNA-binding domain-containing protein [Pseudomonas syringae]MCF5422934.1 type IV secretion system DNA-binding domain-containing protein [Pseudomonas syringae]MCF5460189.1 type IV secretion system DNA-binding domain-containing protein [Pseudomonas syringae]
MTAFVPFDEKILIGYDHQGESVEWCYPELNNFNGLFMGTSGSGKTWTLRNMIARVYRRGTTFHILDVKGDFQPDNFINQGLSNYVGNDDFNVITFSYFDGGSSLNPLQVPRSQEGGGVVMTIENVKELVMKFNNKLGAKQIGYLGEVLKAVYADFNIDHEVETTWTNKAPTFADVFDKLTIIYQCIASGLDSGSVGSIMNEIGRAKRKAISNMRKAREEEQDEDSVALGCAESGFEAANLIAGIVKAQISYENLNRNGTGEEWEHWSKDSIYGLRDTIGGMVESRLFTGELSRVMSGKINVYDMTNISSAHQQIMMDIIARRTFAMSVLHTKHTGNADPTSATHLLVCDEGKHAKAISKQPLSPVNRIATEGRGFGVGVWMGVQQPDQVTQDQLRNFAFYFLLKTPESSNKEMMRMFSLKPNQLKQLEFRENCQYSAGQKYVCVRQFKED